MKKIVFFIPVLILMFFTNCSDSTISDPVEISSERGTLVEVKQSITLTKLVIQVMLKEFDSNAGAGFTPVYDVEVASIVYKTVDANNRIVEASGVVVYPRTEGGYFPLISLHHGTETKRTNVGSQNYIYAFDGVIAASNGYVASVPDYLGLGVSNVFHPYHHEKTSASSTIDMLRATKEFCVKKNILLNKQLFLAGYSQGGYVTLAVQKEIEENLRNEFTVTASAPMAGAYDLYGTALILTGYSNYSTPSFLAYLALSYNEIYDWGKINEIFKSPYNTIIKELFNGNKTTSEINAELPKEMNLLFNKEFLAGLRSGETNYFVKALNENSLLDWSPIAPITFIHGSDDTTVPYENATSAKSSLLNRGAGYVGLYTIEGGNHATSVLPAIEYTLNWFNSYRKGSFNKILLK